MITITIEIAAIQNQCGARVGFLKEKANPEEEKIAEMFSDGISAVVEHIKETRAGYRAGEDKSGGAEPLNDLLEKERAKKNN